jgi:hypothetical protein
VGAGSRELEIVVALGEFDGDVLDRAVGEHDDHRGGRCGQRHELHPAHRDGLGARAHDDAGVVGERASRFEVWWSISSSRPCAAEKNSPTWRVVALSRRPGCVRWSTK